MRRTQPAKHSLTVISNSGAANAPALTDIGDLSDLPPELVAELSASQIDVLERQILTIIEACGGSADLDQILIGLYRRFRVIQKRRFVQNKLWRMVRKGRVENTKSARGVFRLASSKPHAHRKRRRK